MAGVVEKLKGIVRRLRGQSDPTVSVAYELQCECGAAVTGTRRTTWIEAECPQCFQSLFVLPANVYPSTPSVPSTVPSGTFAERLKEVLSELRGSRGKTAAEIPPLPVGERLQESVRTWRERLPKLSLPRLNVRAFIRRVVTPFRLLMIGMVAVIAVTVTRMQHQKAVEEARQVWLQAADEIETLLAEREFIRLEQTLSAATTAGRVLERQDSQWRSASNLQQEVMSLNAVGSGNLLSAILRAYDDSNQLVSDAADIVQRDAEQGVMFFDTYVRPGVENGEFRIAFPVTPGRHAVELTVRLPELSELFADSAEEQRMLFAAEIESVTAPNAAISRDPWRLKIRPDSFVLLTRDELCREVGLDPAEDPDLAATLERQRLFVESSVAWNTRLRSPNPETPTI
ncbi:MAG: hypothetical protein KDA89_15900 [Planctomycetaceae bacterium]|nr:hypothetical protein [Planctomycetaceae bacterium]